MTKGKIIEYQDLAKVLQNLKDKKLVLTGGCFDIIHYGHYCLLNNAKKLGDILLVAIEPDEFIEKRKKRKPLHNQAQRAEMLSGFEFVDFIVNLPYMKQDDDYFKLVKLIKPKYIAVTSEDPQMKNKIKQAELVQAQVVEVCKPIINLSTTIIINDPTIPRD